MNRTCTVGVGGGMESQRAGPFDLQDLPAPRDDLLSRSRQWSSAGGGLPENWDRLCSVTFRGKFPAVP